VWQLPGRHALPVRIGVPSLPFCPTDFPHWHALLEAQSVSLAQPS
jgi:hypothetical protein